MKTTSTLLAISALAANPSSVTSFVVVPASTTNAHVPSSASNFFQPSIQTQLSMAGFGGGGGGATSKKNKKAAKPLPKLKAKTQWDRYADLKQCKKIIVGVKLLSGSDDDEWLEVGKVRSENDEHTLQNYSCL